MTLELSNSTCHKKVETNTSSENRETLLEIDTSKENLKISLITISHMAPCILKSLSSSLETNPNLTFLNWVNRSGLERFQLISSLEKNESKCSGNSKILLITVSHMACNLQNLFLEA